jgi:hypothetical protein
METPSLGTGLRDRFKKSKIPIADKFDNRIYSIIRSRLDLISVASNEVWADLTKLLVFEN